MTENLLNKIITKIKECNPQSIHWIHLQYLEDTIELAHISGYKDIVDRGINLINNYQFEIDVEDEKREFKTYKLPTNDVITKNLPKINNDELIKYINNLREPHLDKTLSNNYKKAFEIAKNERQKEEIILTQLVIGDVENALKYHSELQEDFRRDNVLLITGLELYRRGYHEKAMHYLQAQIDKNSIFIMFWIACILEDRMPWSGYPNPDY
ncbi:MAG: hypothetical protein CMO01_10625 [Thalassobius sp.]|nr:hypothetical protein [Thalassovita sp.]